MKKILALIMVALLIFCMASCGKKDADDADNTEDTNAALTTPSTEVESGTFKFGKNAEGEYEIIEYKHKSEAKVDLELPKTTADGIDIVGIATGAFKYDKTIKSLTIPDTYKYVGKQAFNNCFYLTSVTMSNSMTHVYENAFQDCKNLSSVTWSTSLNVISDFAFAGCTSLTSVNLPAEVTVVGESAFQGCTALTDVTLSDKLVSIDRHAFLECPNLKFTAFDNGNYLGTKANPHLAFIGVKSLGVEDCIVNDNTKIIATNAFENCEDLRDVTLGKSVTYVNGDCFTGSPYINYVTYDNNVNYLKLGTAEDAALAMISIEKTAVETITVHEKTAIITDTALEGCDDLSDISYAKSAADWNKIKKSDTWNHDLAITIHCANNEKITTN